MNALSIYFIIGIATFFITCHFTTIGQIIKERKGLTFKAYSTIITITTWPLNLALFFLIYIISLKKGDIKMGEHTKGALLGIYFGIMILGKLTLLFLMGYTIYSVSSINEQNMFMIVSSMFGMFFTYCFLWSISGMLLYDHFGNHK